MRKAYYLLHKERFIKDSERVYLRAQSSTVFFSRGDSITLRCVA